MTSGLLKTWQKLSAKPGGAWLFSRIIGFKIPYTGSISPRVTHLERGKAEVILKDRRAVRNHLNSIHALAQMNLAEFCTGLAMTTQLGDLGRAIVTELKIQYLKKARGTLTAKCSCPPFQLIENLNLTLEATLFDSQGDIVSKAQAEWRISPK